MLSAVKARLDERELRVEQAAGRAFTLDEALAYARKLSLIAAQTQGAPALAELTPREREIAAMIAAGKSNREIARDLVISKRTVETHVSHILTKFDFSNRAKIVRWAIDTGIAPANS